jgi:Zn-finger nucleic acid-binding protein
MFCPVCKKQMMILEYNEVELDHCPICEGVWLDQGELELLLEMDEKKIDLSDIPDTEKSKRRCPHCRKKMIIGHFPETEVMVDVCARDGGLWLDKGELYDIAHSHASVEAMQKVKEFFTDLFDKKQDTEEE